MRLSLSRSLLALACVLVWAESAQAAVSCSGTNFDNTTASNTTITLNFPTANGAGDFKVVAVFNRTNTTTDIDTVSGSVDAAGWQIAQGPVNMQGGGGRGWLVYRENGSAGTESVTVTFTASITSVLAGGWCTGVATSSSFDASATATNFTAATNWDSNTAVATTAGAIFGMTYTGTASVTFTVDGAGEVQLECGGTSRLCLFYEPYATSGNYGFELTAGSNLTGTFLVNAFKEPGGGGSTCTGGLLLLGAGKCDH